MKKLNHKERMDEAAASVIKAQKRRNRRINPKKLFIIKAAMASALATGIIAESAYLIYKSSSKDPRSTYMIADNAPQANDFIYGSQDNAHPVVIKDIAGEQTIIRAQQGPVKFVSNYADVYDEEKLTDLLSWFYHDVSWGPEIASLSNIKLLSGVQSDDGTVTLGYHTTSRDSSTIILSPDVVIGETNEDHFYQSLAYYFMTNDHYKTNAQITFDAAPITQNPNVYRDIAGIGDHGGNYRFVKLIKDVANTPKIIGAFKVIVDENGDTLFNSNGQVYTISENANYTFNYKIKLYKSLPKATRENIFVNGGMSEADAEAAVDRAFAGVFAFPSPSIRQYDKTDRSELIKILQNGLNDAFMENLVKNVGNKIWRSVDAYFPEAIHAIDQSLLQNSNISNNIKTDFLSKLYNVSPYSDIIRDVDLPFLISMIHDGLFEKILLPKRYKENQNIIGPLSEDGPNRIHSFLASKMIAGVDLHQQTMALRLKYFKNEEELVAIFKNLLLGEAPVLQHLHKNKVSAIINIPTALFKVNGIFSQALPGKDYPHADVALLNIYRKLNAMSNEQLDNLTAQELVDIVLRPGTIHAPGYENSEYTQNDINNLWNKCVNDQNEWLMQLSMHLQDKYHPGEVIDGVRHHGIPVYKAGDSFFDSIIRRAAQTIMYEVSHEYGHHTTMWYSQDLSSYNGLKSIGNNADPSSTIVYSSEGENANNQELIADGAKYRLFRDSFHSDRFQKLLDYASDADSSTDLTQQYYTDRFVRHSTQGAQGVFDTFNVIDRDAGIEGANLPNPAIVPLYLGPVSQGVFGNELSGKSLITNLFNNINAYNANHLMSASDFGRHIDTLFISQLIKNTEYVLDYHAPDFGQQIFNNLAETMQGKELWGDLFSFITDANNQYPQSLPDADGNTQPLYIYQSKGGILGFVKNIIDTNTRLANKLLQENNSQEAFENIFTAITNAANTLHSHNAQATDIDKTNAIFEALKNVDRDVLNTFITELRNISTHYASVFQMPITPGFVEVFNFFTTISTLGSNAPTENLLAFMEHYLTSIDYINPASETRFQQTASGAFQKQVYERAQAYIDATDGANAINGEIITNALYEITGENTRQLLEIFIGNTDATLITDKDGNVVQVQDLSLEDQVKLLSEILTTIMPNNFIIRSQEVIAASGSRLEQEAEEIIIDPMKRMFLSMAALLNVIIPDLRSATFDDYKAGVGLELELDEYFVTLGDEFKTKVFDVVENGGTFFNLQENSLSSPAAVIYVFNHQDDQERFHRHFSTARNGVVDPTSYNRYSTSYVESLTRAWNQFAYVIEPELMTQSTRYFHDDVVRFAAEGIFFHNIQEGGDGSLTQQGQDTIAMFRSFYNMDREISTIIRNKASGLYSFIGYSDEVNQYDKLVFQDTNGNIVADLDMIYNIDNFHYYATHGVSTSSQPLDESRHSWMTDFSVLGSFSNTLLETGQYYLSFWKDANNDGVMQDSELTAILNGDINNNGQMNNNGKTDQSAEIIGNPDNSNDQTDRFKIKIEDIRV